jgi:hypothetical protein
MACTVCPMSRSDPSDLVRNWRESNLPLAEKVLLAVRNNLIKVRAGSSCCGHPGEPGC